MRFALYIIVGVIAWLVDVSIYHLTWSLLGIASGQLLARLAGAATAFLLNQQITFRASKDLSGFGPQAFKYAIVLALNWAVSVGLIYFLSYALSISPLTAKILTDIIIVPSNYFIMKIWVFPMNQQGCKSE